MPFTLKELIDEKFALGPGLESPILGIPGLPDHLTSLEVIIKGNDIVRLRCERQVSVDTYTAIQEAWTPVFAEYRLVKISDEAGAPEELGTLDQGEEGSGQISVSVG